MYTYLKFGLPRVFPPNGSRHRDGSSGYDSSDDGISPKNAQNKKSQSYYLRTRSDPDFRNTPYYGVSNLKIKPKKITIKKKPLKYSFFISALFIYSRVCGNQVLI